MTTVTWTLILILQVPTGGTVRHTISNYSTLENCTFVGRNFKDGVNWTCVSAKPITLCTPVS
jgi:hypothetical protein